MNAPRTKKVKHLKFLKSQSRSVGKSAAVTITINHNFSIFECSVFWYIMLQAGHMAHDIWGVGGEVWSSI